MWPASGSRICTSDIVGATNRLLAGRPSLAIASSVTTIDRESMRGADLGPN